MLEKRVLSKGSWIVPEIVGSYYSQMERKADVWMPRFNHNIEGRIPNCLVQAISVGTGERQVNTMRLFIAVANQALRLAMQVFLHQEKGMDVIGLAADSNKLLAKIDATEPDVLLLDWQLPGKCVVELIKEIHALEMPIRIIVISMRPEDELVLPEFGVDGFIGMSNLPEELMDSLRTLRDRQ